MGFFHRENRVLQVFGVSRVELWIIGAWEREVESFSATKGGMGMEGGKRWGSNDVRKHQKPQKERMVFQQSFSGAKLEKNWGVGTPKLLLIHGVTCPENLTDRS